MGPPAGTPVTPRLATTTQRALHFVMPSWKKFKLIFFFFFSCYTYPLGIQYHEKKVTKEGIFQKCKKLPWMFWSVFGGVLTKHKISGSIFFKWNTQAFKHFCFLICFVLFFSGDTHWVSKKPYKKLCQFLCSIIIMPSKSRSSRSMHLSDPPWAGIHLGNTLLLGLIPTQNALWLFKGSSVGIFIFETSGMPFCRANIHVYYCRIYHWLRCELSTQLIFPFKIIFCNLIEFSMTKTTQNSISPTP
jgi:hypothetical protein